MKRFCSVLAVLALAMLFALPTQVLAQKKFTDEEIKELSKIFATKEELAKVVKELELIKGIQEEHTKLLANIGKTVKRIDTKQGEQDDLLAELGKDLKKVARKADRAAEAAADAKAAADRAAAKADARLPYYPYYGPNYYWWDWPVNVGPTYVPPVTWSWSSWWASYYVANPYYCRPYGFGRWYR